jgi:LmbE family N-acetylglucosaminyl deacetylase
VRWAKASLRLQSSGLYRKTLNAKQVKSLSRLSKTPLFGRAYALVAFVVLLATTLLWAILSANLHAGNADQLINSYLFENNATFHGAVFPGQHSFLMKWPLFFLIRVFGYSSTAFTVFTVATVILTVSMLALILYTINRRPMVFGTLCLALASVLLLVPAMPYAGGILPVNMAMIATRNLEYVLFIAGLALLAASHGIKSRRFWLAAAILSLLIASDKLFLTLGLGGALLALVVYALAKGWNLVSLSVAWLMAVIVAALAALGILWLLGSDGLTHIATQAGLGPYGLAGGAKDLGLGIIFAGLGLLTNFGANPALGTTYLRDLPHQARINLLSYGGLAYLINLALLLAGLFFAWRLLSRSLAHNRNRTIAMDPGKRLGVMLIWTSTAAAAVFILSNHYYAADARYLTISLFTLFIAVAAYARNRKWRPPALALTGLLILIAILLGIPTAINTYRSDKAALAPINQRNEAIGQILAKHPVSVLVGDYWRVIPTRQASRQKINVMPLSGCSQPRDVLSSSIWQPNLQDRRFAYLLSLDKSLTDFPSCNLQQVVKAYGRPNSSVLVAGTLDRPKEVLLFYDRGTNKSSPTTAQPAAGPATVVPINLDELPFTSCKLPTIMNVVAHQDDDLLFMSPDLLHDISQGHCIRTIYITAGDAGRGNYYWLSREEGSEAAYSKMAGLGGTIWVHRILRLPGGQFLTIASPRGNSRISLVFMHLPDGNIKGDGFSASHFESLAKLESGKVSQLHAIDGQSVYSGGQLADALSDLMQTYLPSEIRTQANYIGQQFPDHSDHMAVGRYVKKAYAKFETEQYENRVAIPLKFYIGYPVHEMPENVADTDLSDKQAAFFAYARFDGGVCQSLDMCIRTPTYNAYLRRQYQNQE